MTSQVALSRRGTSPGEWEVVVNDMSDYPGGSLFFFLGLFLDFLVYPVWFGIKLGVAGIGTTAQCVVGGERRGLAAWRENWIYISAGRKWICRSA